MKAHEMFPSKYLQGEDIRGKTVRATIDHYEMEPVGEDQEMKPVLYFRRAKKGMILNKTNADVLFGMRDDAEKWGGLEVEIYFDPSIRFGKKVTGGIRLRSVSQAPAQTLEDQPPPPDDSEIGLEETESVFD